MEVDNPQVDDLPDSAVVDAEEPTSEPLPDEALPDESTAAPPAPKADQGEPKGDEPAKGEGEGDEPEPDDPESGKDAPRRRKSDPRKSINRLTRQAREAEREAAYWRGRAEAQAEAAQVTEPAPKPKLEDFDSAEDFADALADWKVEQKEAAPDRSQQEPSSPAEPARKATEAEVQSYTAAKLKYADLDDVLFDTSLPWTSHMADAVSDMENAAEVLYHLGQDDEEIARIAQLGPKAQEREVWRFAEKLSQTLGTAAPENPDAAAGEGDEPGDEPAPQTTAKPRAAVSRAQPVPSTITGRASTTKSPDEMTDAEYIAWGDQQEAERRRRGG